MITTLLPEAGCSGSSLAPGCAEHSKIKRQTRSTKNFIVDKRLHYILASWQAWECNGCVTYIYIYIYIYTSVNPCITCTKQGGAEQKLIPIKDEQGAALFERPFRTQETNAPHGCGLERHFSSSNAQGAN